MRVALNVEQLAHRPPGGIGRYTAELARLLPVTGEAGPEDDPGVELVTFMARVGRVQSREQLLSDVWEMSSEIETRTVDTHILRLRQKLEKDPTDPVHFRTVHGTGYKFVR